MSIHNHRAQMSQPSSQSSLASVPASPTSSLRSVSSSCSDASDNSYRELQQENHKLRKQLHQDRQRFAIVLDQYRQGERAAQKMQQRLDDLTAALEEANTKLLDVLEENHELRRSFVDLRRNTTSRGVTMPSPLTRTKQQQQQQQKRGTFLEVDQDDSILDNEQEEDIAQVTTAAVEEDDVEETSKTLPRLSTVPTLTLDDLQISPSTRTNEITPLSSLSCTPPPSERRDAISAAQDSYLARSLLQMSASLAQTPRKSSSSSAQGPAKKSLTGSSKQGSSQRRAKHTASETVPVTLTSAKRLPKSRKCASAALLVGGVA